jgi:hypothetical protein
MGSDKMKYKKGDTVWTVIDYDKDEVGELEITEESSRGEYFARDKDESLWALHERELFDTELQATDYLKGQSK